MFRKMHSRKWKIQTLVMRNLFTKNMFKHHGGEHACYFLLNLDFVDSVCAGCCADKLCVCNCIIIVLGNMKVFT